MLPLLRQHINLIARLMVNFEGHGCSFFQKEYKHACLPIWCLFYSPLRTQPDPKKPRGLPATQLPLVALRDFLRLMDFPDGFLSSEHLQSCPDTRIWIWKTEPHPCRFLLTLLTSLPSFSPLSSSLLSSSIVLFFFFCAHCCLQQLLNFTYLGSPLTCCLLEHHIVSRDVGQNQSCHPPPPPPGSHIPVPTWGGRRGRTLPPNSPFPSFPASNWRFMFYIKPDYINFTKSE